jgi:exonuclease VII large subunit
MAFADKDRSGQINSAEGIIFSVSEYLDMVSASLEKVKVEVTGEITSLNNHPTGIYVTLKDEQEEAILNCYMNPWVYKVRSGARGWASC